MHPVFCVKGLLALGLLAFLAGAAWADRVPMTRTPGQYSRWPLSDSRVPYLTTGRTAFGAYWVAPRIYSSPIVDYPPAPGAKPVYNLIFYGGVQGFGTRSEGATPRHLR